MKIMPRCAAFNHQRAACSLVEQYAQEVPKSQIPVVSVIKKNKTLTGDLRSWTRTNNPRNRIAAPVTKVGIAYRLKV